MRALKLFSKTYLGRLWIPRDRILSAVSQDGLSWQREKGVRVDVGGILHNEMAYYTYALQPEDQNGKWEIYYHSSCKDTNSETWKPRILKATSEDGLKFTTSSRPVLSAGGSIYNRSQTRAPHLRKFRHIWRLFFTARGNDGQLRILSASSHNREKWAIEEGYRLAPESLSEEIWDHDGHEVVGTSDTSIVELPDKSYRMYFSVIYDDERIQKIASAISQDGLKWNPEKGVRIAPRQTGFVGLTNNPSVIKCPNGWRMYFRSSNTPPLWSNIYSAFSTDGLKWKPEGLRLRFSRSRINERNGVAFPFVTAIGGGAYRMYYTGYWGHLFDFRTVAYYK